MTYVGCWDMRERPPRTAVPKGLNSAYFLYDAAGRQIAQPLPPNEAGGPATPTYFLYDVLGRRQAVTDALGHSAYFHTDAAGQQTASVDALGYVTYYYYDSLGRQYAVRDAADGLVYYTYDALGRRTALVLPTNGAGGDGHLLRLRRRLPPRQRTRPPRQRHLLRLRRRRPPRQPHRR